MIADGHGVTRNKAEWHLDYLIKNGMLPQLKRGGRVVSSQATTTQRTAITTEKLLRNHTTYEMAIEQLRNLNGNSEEFKAVEDHFHLNCDESNMRANEGVVKVMGNKAKKKQEKNKDDSRESISVLRAGSSGGSEGPRVYLGSGKEMPRHLKDFTTNHKAPPGSHVQMTPSGYMTDDAWKRASPEFCKGIREMRVIKDHPEWWCLLSLDGFGSHLLPEALEIFAEYKILVFKEEGDASQVCQAYDQQVAVHDKRLVRDMLDGYRFNMHGVVNQFELILTVNAALNEADPKLWRTSSIRVNTCPSQRIPFEQWIKKHKSLVGAADVFFDSRDSLYDASEFHLNMFYAFDARF